MYRKVVLAAILMFTVLVWTKGEESRARENTLIFGLKGNVGSLDYIEAYNVVKNVVCAQIMEGLLEYDENEQVVPLLAKSWVRVNPTTFTFRLRKGIKFHNGEELTAEDVVYSLGRVRDAELNSPMKWMYDNVDRIEKISDDLIRITLHRPDATFQYVLATSAGYITSKKYALEQGANLTTHPIGTGPFKLERWQPGKEIVLVKNSDYWQSGLPYLDKVIFKIIPNTQDRIRALKGGRIQMADYIPANEVRKMPNIEPQLVTGFHVNYIALNNRKPPFNNRRVRQAVNFAVNRDKFLQGFKKQEARLAASTSVPPNMWGSAYDSVKKYNYSVATALQLLSNTPYKNGVKVELLVSEDELRLMTARAIKRDLQEIGVDVAIKVIPFDQLIDLAYYEKYDYDMICVGWSADFPDPDGMLYPLFHSQQGTPRLNFAYYRNEAVDRKLDLARLLYNQQRREELYQEIQKIIAEDAPWIWLYYSVYATALNREFSGYHASPIYSFHHFLRTVRRR